MTAAVLETDPKEWQASALGWIEALAMTGREFSADDIRDKIPAPHHSSAWGRAFTLAQERHLITYVEHRRSKTPSRKGGVVAIWTAAPSLRRS